MADTSHHDHSHAHAHGSDCCGGASKAKEGPALLSQVARDLHFAHDRVDPLDRHRRATLARGEHVEAFDHAQWTERDGCERGEEEQGGEELEAPGDTHGSLFEAVEPDARKQRVEVKGGQRGGNGIGIARGAIEQANRAGGAIA